MRTDRALATDYLAFDQWNAQEIASVEASLGARERRELEHFTHPERRRQWLSGRYLVKRLLNDTPFVAATSSVEILSRDARALGTRPRVVVDSCELNTSISLSHNAHGVLACVSREFAVGVDLIEPGVRSDGFYRLWFHDSERQWIDEDRANRGPLVWSIKEAVYKAVNQGEGWDPRAVEVDCCGDSFESAMVSYRGQLLDKAAIEWIDCDNQLAVIVSLSAANRVNRVEAQVALCS